MHQKFLQISKIRNFLSYPKLQMLLTYVTLLYGSSVILIVSISKAEVLWMRLFFVTIVFFFLLLALLNNIIETSRAEQAWQKLANQTGLTCQTLGSIWTGFAVNVTGIYKGRQLKLSTSRRNAQVPATRIEINIENIGNASMRLRGPFHEKSANYDIVAKDLFAATAARQFGRNHRFFVRSYPLHLVTNLLRAEALWEKLSGLEGLVNIELEGHTLYFEKFGVPGDADYLNNLFDILTDIADVIEAGCKMRAFACQPNLL